MNPGTQITLGALAVCFLVFLLAAVLWVSLNSQSALHKQMAVSISQPPTAECKIDQPATYNYKKNADDWDYTFTITQPYRYQNPTDHYIEFRVFCETLHGPSRQAENKVSGTRFIVSPRSPWRYASAEFVWTNAWKLQKPQVYLYDCTCKTKIVERPIRKILVPFVPTGQ